MIREARFHWIETLRPLTWLTDASQDAVDGWKDYYGLRDERFAAYPATLGLRRSDGTPKPALDALASEADARGW